MLDRATDPPPARITNADGASRYLLIGDHAGNAVPAALGMLGLERAELERHIGWDIGVAGLGRALAATLDAAFVEQRYSRLVVDCNRGPDARDAVPEVSDGTRVPGNAHLTPQQRAARFAAIHEPYHRTIADALARRDADGRPTVLVALHSFTPAMAGRTRPWHVGVLHHLGDTRFAMDVLSRLRAEQDLVVGDNEPYRMEGTDYSVPRHAYPARPYLELEIRQDLLADEHGRREWNARIARILSA